MIHAMFKLIIQIPCLNEAETLPVVIASLPREVSGADVVEFMVIDDGSIDGTADVARDLGVEHIVRLPRNRGLAAAFARGLEEAVRRGADVVVNTDGDNQYRGADIPLLVAPIAAGEADVVVGSRDIWGHREFGLIKKLLQRLGSRVVAFFAGSVIPDATSGFRAYSREAALRITVRTRFSYTLETLIQAHAKGLLVAHVPIRVNTTTRPSRLFRSIPQYVLRSTTTMVRVFTAYYPLRFFLLCGLVLFGFGSAIGLRFLVEFTAQGGAGHVQSLVLSAVFLIVGAHCWLMGFHGEATAANRLNTEELLYLRRRELWSTSRESVDSRGSSESS